MSIHSTSYLRICLWRLWLFGLLGLFGVRPTGARFAKPEAKGTAFAFFAFKYNASALRCYHLFSHVYPQARSVWSHPTSVVCPVKLRKKMPLDLARDTTAQRLLEGQLGGRVRQAHFPGDRERVRQHSSQALLEMLRRAALRLEG